MLCVDAQPATPTERNTTVAIPAMTWRRSDRVTCFSNISPSPYGLHLARSLYCLDHLVSRVEACDPTTIHDEDVRGRGQGTGSVRYDHSNSTSSFEAEDGLYKGTISILVQI